MGDRSLFVMHDRVRWADVDLIGIMRFSAYTRLIENGEQELLRAAGLSFAKIFDHPEIWMPRRHLSIEYFAPARIDDALSIVAYVTRMGDTSATLQFDVRLAERWTLLASASLVIVCVTVTEFTKCPLPSVMREALAPYEWTIEAARAQPLTGESGAAGGAHG